jgi:hypothetical protein
VILKQIFLTRAGVNKRVAFERAHSGTHDFVAVLCSISGEPFGYSWVDKPKEMEYSDVRFRIEKVRKGQPLSLSPHLGQVHKQGDYR